LQYKKLNNKLEAMSESLEKIQDKDNNLYRVLLEKQPIPATVRQAGFGGADKYEGLLGYDNSDLLVETSKKVDVLSKKLDIQTDSYSELLVLAKLKMSELQSMPAIRPVSDRRASISSMFGYRMHPILKRRKMHDGIDFTAPIGTPVYAPADGTVESAGYDGGLGRTLKIRHGFGYLTVYGHLSQIKTVPGQKVKRGELIALIGNSGLSSGPHLHYEVVHYGVLIDPINFFFSDINPEDYNKMLVASAEQKREAGK
jgi:murein DD-endopeptidase MepM/ murein hydrolase activator NlpD